ncbi:AI-2E family transporter [Streptomyces sp. NPDC004327]|uniref:AI-2E family transporter n=1 Tax=Streptomyces sp. NPDC004327 TaxID=3364699 RepID=UPI003698FB54
MQPGTPPAVAPFLRTAAAYAWRLLVVGVLFYALFAILGRFHEVGVALFLGLVITALLRPVADIVAKGLPRPFAVALTLLGSIALVLGILTLVGEAVAGESTTLAREFRDGVGRIEHWLQRPPFRLNPRALSDVQSRIGEFLSSHRATLLSQALSGASRLIAVLATLVLALFSSVFFIHSGDRQWAWFRDQLPASVQGRADLGARAAWRTLTGYTHGIVLVAATNALLVGIALWVLGVPLAVPLALLEFVAAFVPLFGSPVALAVAAVVALASKGPLVAAIVIVLIVVIGQIEGHLLHPLVMSWAVRLHPLVVAISVVAGTIAAGIVGAVVAVPMVSVVWSAYTALRDARAAERALAEDAAGQSDDGAEEEDPEERPAEGPEERPAEGPEERPAEGPEDESS